jgi:uncharacterized membrane protein
MTNRVKLIAIILALVGLADSIYLTWIKLSDNEALCIKGVGDCWSVNNSPYASWNGIPIALFGAAAYLAILVVIIYEKKGAWFTSISDYLLFAITLAGTLYSAYLTYLEIAVIKAICPYCVLSALVMLALFVLSVIRLVRPQTI